MDVRTGCYVVSVERTGVSLGGLVIVSVTWRDDHSISSNGGANDEVIECASYSTATIAIQAPMKREISVSNLAAIPG